MQKNNCYSHIVCKRLKLLRKAGNLQLIQNSAPSLARWRQCDIQSIFIRINYCKVESSNMSCLETHASFFRLLMKGIFDPYVTSHSAYAATETELYAAKIDGLLPPNFL